jgi:hypothetical protein
LPFIAEPARRGVRFPVPPVGPGLSGLSVRVPQDGPRTRLSAPLQVPCARLCVDEVIVVWTLAGTPRDIFHDRCSVTSGRLLWPELSAHNGTRTTCHYRRAMSGQNLPEVMQRSLCRFAGVHCGRRRRIQRIYAQRPKAPPRRPRSIASARKSPRRPSRTI